MTTRTFVPLVLVAAAALAAACGGSSSPAPAPTPTVTAVAITGNDLVGGTLGISGPSGTTSQLTATATMSDKTTQNVTSQATWQSGNTAVATVSTGGLVTAVGNGQTDIRATYQGVTGTAPAIVTLIDLNGTWTGSATDSTGQFIVSLTITQTGANVTGTATLSDQRNGSVIGTGNISGTLNGPTLTFTITTHSSSCTITLTGTTTGIVTSNVNQMSGTYTGTNSCSGPIANGLFTLAKQ